MAPVAPVAPLRHRSRSRAASGIAARADSPTSRSFVRPSGVQRSELPLAMTVGASSAKKSSSTTVPTTESTPLTTAACAPYAANRWVMVASVCALSSGSIHLASCCGGLGDNPFQVNVATLTAHSPGAFPPLELHFVCAARSLRGISLRVAIRRGKSAPQVLGLRGFVRFKRKAAQWRVRGNATDPDAGREARVRSFTSGALGVELRVWSFGSGHRLAGHAVPGGDQPSEPSISSFTRRLNSMAYSIGSSLVKTSRKPWITRFWASFSVRPRLIR
jgi:hypothetical protein